MLVLVEKVTSGSPYTVAAARMARMDEICMIDFEIGEWGWNVVVFLVKVEDLKEDGEIEPMIIWWASKLYL